MNDTRTGEVLVESKPHGALKALLVSVLVVVLVGAVFMLQACGRASEDAEVEETGSAPAESAAQADQTPEEAEEVQYHESDVEVTGDEIAVIETDKGTIKFKFFPEDAPNTVASFIELADSGFYDGCKFHRVEPGFVIQGGDPLSKTDDPMVGTGGPGWYLKAEFNDRPHVDGTVAMARASDPDSAGSQFYITMGPQPFLDGQYTVFGQVIEGLDVVYKIEVGDVMKRVYIERPQGD